MQLDANHLLIFGGIDKRTRYNDVWVLNYEEKAWKQVEVAPDPEAPGVPEPRAHFTATRFGNKIFIFGGYGGSGQVYSDTWILHVDDEGYRWENITSKLEGTGPTPRFDHCAFICECSQGMVRNGIGHEPQPPTSLLAMHSAYNLSSDCCPSLLQTR